MQAEGEVCKQKLRKSCTAFLSFLFPPSQGIHVHYCYNGLLQFSLNNFPLESFVMSSMEGLRSGRANFLSAAVLKMDVHCQQSLSTQEFSAIIMSTNSSAAPEPTAAEGCSFDNFYEVWLHALLGALQLPK